MKQIATCTPDSQNQMTAAISAGKKYALHLESQDRISGVAFFAATIEELRNAFRCYARGFDQWMLAEYTADLRGEKQIKRGWL